MKCAQYRLAASGWDGFVASRIPVQAPTGCGGRQRIDPTGGLAKGIPKNTAILSCSFPRSSPLARWTIGPVDSTTGSF